jgi:hypothetical protein
MKRITNILFFLIVGLYSYAGSNKEILDIVRHVEVRNNQLTTVDTVVVLIHNAHGEEEVSVQYDKINKLRALKAWLEDDKGIRIRELTKKEFEDRNLYQESSLFDDQRERVFTPNHHRYPYRLVYTSSIVSREFFSLVSWYTLSSESEPLRQARLYVHLPKDYPVHALTRGVTDIRSDTLTDQIVTRYVIKPRIVPDEELNNPGSFREGTFVRIVPERFVYEVEGSHASWAEFGNWVERLNAGLTKLPATEVQKIRNLVEGMKDTVDIIRTLYHYMQDQTRYVNVSLGTGGMKSYPAEYVSNNKYGDCKALTTYLQALLQCVGIRSQKVLVYRSEYPILFYPDFPSSQFNHVLLMVPVSKDSIWLENTSSIVAMGYVDVSVQNRPALLIEGMKSRMIRTPSISRENCAGERHVTVEWNSEGDAVLSLKHLGRGWEYEYMSELQNAVSSKSQTEYLDRFIPFNHYEIERYNLFSKDRDSTAFRLDVRLRMTHWIQSVPNGLYFSQVPIYKGLYRYYKPGSCPIQIPLPINMSDTVEYKLPANVQVVEKAEPITIVCPYGSYTSSYIFTDQKILNHKTLKIQGGILKPEEYKVLYEFIRKITDTEKKSIYLKTNIQ